VDITTFYDESYWSEGKHAGFELPEPYYKKVFGPVLDGDSVLDYGCGLGHHYQRRMATTLKRYVGADASDMAVADARRKGLEAVKVNPNDGSVPLPANTFDGAVCIEVFEHLFDPLSAAKELNRVLRPGGTLVATVPNFGYHAWRMLAFLRAQVPLEPEDFKKNRYKGVHIRYFSKLMFKRLLNDAGFVDVKIGSYDHSSVWDVFQATGKIAIITTIARKHFPGFMHLRFLQHVWPNVFAVRLRAVARKPR
jgi:SAM-dependent methyltransferase